MAQRRITELPVATVANGTDVLLMRQSGTDKQVTVDKIKAYLETSLGSTYLEITNNLSDVANSTTAFNNIKVNGTTTFTGVLELATNAEATTGTDTSRAVTPAGVKAAVDSATTGTALGRVLTPLKTSGWINGTNTISQAWDDFEQIVVVASEIEGIDGLTQSHSHHTIYTDLVNPYDSAPPRGLRIVTDTGSALTLSFGDTDRTKIYLAHAFEDDRMVAMYGRYRK